VLVNTFVNKWSARQVVATKRRQVFVGGFCEIQKTAVSLAHHCSLPFKRPVKHFESDGFMKESGRRDSNPRQPAWKAGTLPD
jgi:hypothetical protein